MLMLIVERKASAFLACKRQTFCFDSHKPWLKQRVSTLILWALRLVTFVGWLLSSV